MYKVIDQIDLKEKKVFIRVDYNVKIKNGKVVDDTRIRASLPTIKYALDQDAKVILASHLGRPKGEVKPEFSLLPVAEHLSHLLEREVIFPEDCVGDAARKIVQDMRPGQILLLENLRFHAGEEKNEPQFASKLAALAEVYINDAFGTAHRAHASTEGMVKQFSEKGMGYLMQKEVEVLGRISSKPEKPFLAILGGAKVSDKIGVIENLMNHVSGFIIGGAMANTFLKAQDVNVGKSLVEDTKLNLAHDILGRAKLRNIEIILPVDAVITNEISETAKWKVAANNEDWGDNMAVDIGPETLKLFEEKVKAAKTVFWNGPMGVFETKPFDQGTNAIAKMIADTECTSVAGGGDSLSAIKNSGFENHFTHLSTGGGASMEFLEGKLLPGLKALQY